MTNPLKTEQRQADRLDRRISRAEAALIAAWFTAWARLQPNLEDALAAAMADGPVSATSLLRSRRLAAVLAQVLDRLESVVTTSARIVNKDVPWVIDRGAADSDAQIQVQLPGDLRKARIDPTLAAITERTREQVTSLLWPLADDTYSVILSELIKGVAVGENPRETARRMVNRAQDHFNFGRARALNIARTEMLDAYRRGAEVSQNAHSDVLDGWVWLAHLGPRTCPACLARHGTFHELRVAGPDGHQSCRCSRTPVVDREDLGWVPDAEAFFWALPEADQLAIMGPERLALLRSGRIEWKDLARKQRNPAWRDSWVTRPVKSLV